MPSKCGQDNQGDEMNTIKDWIRKLTKNEGSFISKDRLIQEIRKSTKTSLPIDYQEGNGILIVCIPVSNTFRI